MTEPQCGTSYIENDCSRHCIQNLPNIIILVCQAAVAAELTVIHTGGNVRRLAHLVVHKIIANVNKVLINKQEVKQKLVVRHAGQPVHEQVQNLHHKNVPQ